MAKYTLEEDFDYDFKIIMISCHNKDYRLCWEINKVLDIQLTREEDIIYKKKRVKEPSHHSVFSYSDPETRNHYKLISNSSSGIHLLSDNKQADFVLMIEESYPVDLSDISKSLRSIPIVLACYTVEPEALKEKDNLVF